MSLSNLPVSGADIVGRKKTSSAQRKGELLLFDKHQQGKSRYRKPKSVATAFLQYKAINIPHFKQWLLSNFYEQGILINNKIIINNKNKLLFKKNVYKEVKIKRKG